MAQEPNDGHDDGDRPKSSSHKLVAVLGVLTALLTCTTAALGLFTAQAQQDRNEAESQASTLSTQVSDLTGTITALESERDSMEAEIAELEEQRDQLRTSLDEATQAGDIDDEDVVSTAGSTYLAELEPIDGSYFSVESPEVHGQPVLRSIVQELECPDAAQWNLGGRYSEFRAWVGLDDESENRDARARFTVSADGEVLEEVVLGLSEHEEFVVDVDGRFRLVLEMTLIEPEGCGYHTRGVWGDAELS